MLPSALIKIVPSENTRGEIMLNRFYRFFGCVEDHALECDSVVTNLLTPEAKDSAVESRSMADTLVTTEKAKDNINILQFVGLLNATGYEVKKKPIASQPISIGSSKSILKYGAQTELRTPIPIILWDNEAPSSQEETSTWEDDTFNTPQQTITWGKEQFFYFEDTDSAAEEEQDEPLTAELEASTKTLTKFR
jgi:hypothetical protein